MISHNARNPRGRHGAAVSALALALSLSAFAGQAHAQATDDGEAAADDVKENAPKAADIIVTGTNIRGVAAVGSSSIAITRQEITDSGQTQISDLLRTLPQIQTTSNITETPVPDGPSSNPFLSGSNFANQTKGNSADLRGLGPAATLILIDGRRQLATGTTSSFVETNRLPLSAIERIEIVSDGASAIYGSDAVSGVINYITRKDYQGLEASARYSTNSSYNSWGLSVTGGLKWDFDGRRGSIIVSYDYDRRERMTNADNERLRSDQTAFGGNNATFNVRTPAGLGYYLYTQCAPPNFTFQGVCYSPSFQVQTVATFYVDVPTALGPTGAPITGTPSTSLPQNIQSGDQFRQFLAANQKHALNVGIKQELTDWLEMYYQFNGTLRLTENTTYNINNLTVSRGNPFFPTAIVPASVNSVSVPIQGLLRQATQRDKQYSNTVGFKFELPSEWQGEVYGSWAKASFLTGKNHSVNKDFSVDALNRLIALGQYNPFTGLPSQAVLDRVTPDSYQGPRSSSSLSDYVAKFNGPLFNIPGGAVRAAFGFEHVSSSNDYTLIDDITSCPADTTQVCTVAPVRNAIRSGVASRRVNAVFAEVLVPFFGPENAQPLLRRLDLDMAVRAEHYSDFGTTVNPKIGVTWGVTDSLSFRGSWGTAFRAPNLTELSASSLPVLIPSSLQFYVNNTGNSSYGALGGPVNALTLGGANPNLGPERATNWSLGFDYRGEGGLSGLTVSGTYYNIHYRDKIVSLPVSVFLNNATNASIYANYLTAVTPPAPGTCNPSDPSTYPAQIKPVLNVTPIIGGTGGTICDVTVIVDGRWQNAGRVFQDGIDFNIGYRFGSPKSGNFNVGLNLTKILHIREELVAGKPTTPDPIDRITFPISFRARGTVGWQKGPFTAGLTINYTPGYTNDSGFIRVNPPPAANSAVGPAVQISSWTTADLNLAFDLGRNSPSSVLSGMRFNINVQNVTNSGPPIVLSGTSLNSSYDPRVGNPYGRTFVLQLTKKI